MGKNDDVSIDIKRRDMAVNIDRISVVRKGPPSPSYGRKSPRLSRKKSLKGNESIKAMIEGIRNSRGMLSRYRDRTTTEEANANERDSSMRVVTGNGTI